MVEHIREQQEAINVVLSYDRKASYLIINWQQRGMYWKPLTKYYHPSRK